MYCGKSLLSGAVVSAVVGVAYCCPYAPEESLRPFVLRNDTDAVKGPSILSRRILLRLKLTLQLQPESYHPSALVKLLVE